MSKKNHDLNRKQRKMNCFVKTNRRSKKAMLSATASPVIEMPLIQEAFAPRPVEIIPAIAAPIGVKVKFSLFKKYKAPSIVVLCLTLVLTVFQNCGGGGGGGGGGGSLVSASQIDPKDLSSIEGEYFLSYGYSNLVLLQIDGNNISVEFQKPDDYSSSLFQENVGKLTIVGKNEFKISYTKESCNNTEIEFLKMKTGKINGTLEVATESGKQYVFYKTSKYNLPNWVTSVTERYEDLSCTFESFQTSSTAICAVKAYRSLPRCIVYCQDNPDELECGGTTGEATGGTTGEATGGTTGEATGGTTGEATGGTTAGTTGGTTGGTCQNPSDIYCPEYCQQTPLRYGCLTNGSNCNANPSASGCPGASVTINPYWGVQYPPGGSAPSGTCSEPYAPQGQPDAFATRKGTITLAGLTTGSIGYNPLTASNLLNTSPMLKSVAQAKIFFMTDSILKVRIKPKPQPAASQSDTMCYGRNMPGVTIPGYTKLQYYIKVYGVSAGNALTLLDTKGPFVTSVNSCSDSVDLSEYQEQSPTGVAIAIDQVKANQNCSGSNWMSEGFTNCNIFKNVRSYDCWSMDFEVAADGTKTFD